MFYGTTEESGRYNGRPKLGPLLDCYGHILSKVEDRVRFDCNSSTNIIYKQIQLILLRGRFDCANKRSNFPSSFFNFILLHALAPVMHYSLSKG